MPVLTKINSNVIADDAITGDMLGGSAYLSNTATQNITGTYSENRLYTSDAYTLSGNATINSELILSSVKPNSDIVLTAGGAYTITGTGILSGGSLYGRNILTGMTGELSSSVTGTPAITVEKSNIKTSDFATPYLNVTDGDGNTRSPVARDDKTWWYGDFGDAAGTGTWARSSESPALLVNVAMGANCAHGEHLALSTVQRKTTDDLGASYAQPTGDTEAVRRDPWYKGSGGDPFLLGTSGMTMGCLFRNMHSGAGAKGIIYYGENGQGKHFYNRTNYNAHGQILVGGDTDSGDNWHTCTKVNTQENGWAFFVIAEGVTGSLHCSYNGSAYDLIRAQGTLSDPTAAAFGIFGDLYDDNESAHKFATCFWYEGIMSEELIRAEYRFIKNKWSKIKDLP